MDGGWEESFEEYEVVAAIGQLGGCWDQILLLLSASFSLTQSHKADGGATQRIGAASQRNVQPASYLSIPSLTLHTPTD